MKVKNVFYSRCFGESGLQVALLMKKRTSIQMTI